MGRRDDTTDGQQDTPKWSRLRVRGRDHHASSSDRSETAVSWIVVTLLSSAVLGMIGVLDKAFLYHYARTHLTLPLLIGIGHIPIGIVFIAISPLDDLTVGSAGWSLAAGVFGGLGGVIFFRVVARREVSQGRPGHADVPDLRRAAGRALLGREPADIRLVRHPRDGGGRSHDLDTAGRRRPGTRHRPVILRASGGEPFDGVYEPRGQAGGGDAAGLLGARSPVARTRADAVGIFHPNRVGG